MLESEPPWFEAAKSQDDEWHDECDGAGPSLRGVRGGGSSAAQKAQIVEESFGEADSVSAVARRHGLSSTQLFAWRKAAQEMALSAFVPVLVEPAMTSPPAVVSEPRQPRRRRAEKGRIELEIDGVTVRVGRGAEAQTVAAVIQALKAAR